MSTPTSLACLRLLRRAAAQSAGGRSSLSFGCASSCTSSSFTGRGTEAGAWRRGYHGIAPGSRAPEREEPPKPSSRRVSPSASAARFSASASASSGEPQPDAEKEEQTTTVVYRGALGPSLRRLKLVSLANTAVALAASPALSWLADCAPEASSAAAYARAAAVAATAAGFGVLTTLGLHWFAKPYVHEIVRISTKREGAREEQQEGDPPPPPPPPPHYRLRALSALGRPAWRPLDVAAVRPADVSRPLATFETGGRVYYVDAAGFAEGEDALRQALSPLSPAEAAHVAAEAEAAAEAAEAAAAAAEAAEAEKGNPQEEQQGVEERYPPREEEGKKRR